MSRPLNGTKVYEVLRTVGLCPRPWGSLTAKQQQLFVQAACLLNIHADIVPLASPQEQERWRQANEAASTRRQQARSYACEVLADLVKQGATTEQLISRWAITDALNAVQVGGTVQMGNTPRPFNTNQLIVTQLAGYPCFEVFSVRSLLADMAQPQDGTHAGEQGPANQ